MSSRIGTAVRIVDAIKNHSPVSFSPGTDSNMHGAHERSLMGRINLAGSQAGMRE